MASTSMTETLPIELTTEIIEHLAASILEDDSDTITYASSLKDLKACSLVCRSFVPLCQKFIFKSIELLPTHDTARLPSGTVKSLDPRTSILKFCDIVENSPAIGGYVHEFIMWIIPPGRMSQEFEVDFPRNTVTSVLRSLINLRSIGIFSWTSFAEIYWDELPSSFTSEIYRLFELPTLKRIRLGFVENFNALPCIGLEELSLVNCSLSENPSQVSSTMAPIKPVQLIHLSDLSYMTTNDRRLPPQLISSKLPDGTFAFSFERLESFEAILVHSDDVRRVSSFLQQRKFPSLKKLILCSIAATLVNDEIAVLLLSHAMKTIKILEIRHTANASTHLCGTLGFLEAMSTDNQIQIIKFSIRYSPDSRFDFKDDPNWDVLNNTLLALQWPSLTKVHFEITSILNISQHRPRRASSEAISICNATVEKLPETRLKGLSSSQSFKFIWDFKAIVRNI